MRNLDITPSTDDDASVVADIYLGSRERHVAVRRSLTLPTTSVAEFEMCCYPEADCASQR